VTTEARGVDGLLQDSDIEGIVFEALPSLEYEGRPCQGNSFMVAAAISLNFGQELRVVPVDSTVHHRQKFLGRFHGVLSHYILKKRVIFGKHVLGEMHRVTIIYLDVLLDGQGL
jgi:hypothetical protein